METSLQTDLCKSIRACGVRKDLSHRIVNQIEKWYDSSGPDWTNSRIKDLRQWYETYLAGEPVPPAWFKHDHLNLPVGVWKEVFTLRNQATALAVLSSNTLFRNEKVSPAQVEKFSHGLKGNGKGQDFLAEVTSSDLDTLRKYLQTGKKVERSTVTTADFIRGTVPYPSRFMTWDDLKTSLDLHIPTTEDITGVSIPVGRKVMHVSTQVEREEALLRSWATLPVQSIEFLDMTDHLDWLSPYFTGHWSPFARLTAGEDTVGKIGLIQEPELKLRSVANPNRVAQKLTEPLALLWDDALSLFPTDCTYDQSAGYQWVQEKLRKGVTLAGSDMTSATDLLNLDGCLHLANTCVMADILWMLKRADVRDKVLSISPLGHSFSSEHLSLSREARAAMKDFLEQYSDHVEYFTALSRGTWWTPRESGLGDVHWTQGQPLGLYPSFRLLALTNNSLGCIAAFRAGLDPGDCFRVIGDDIIMDQRMAEQYEILVASLGGEINHSKTLTSNRVAEFAGRIITPERIMLKRVKFKEMSDDSFMETISSLGPQSKSLLRPRQRKVWEVFKYVPGVVFDGPWSQDSFGAPLSDRVTWTLTDTDLLSQTHQQDLTTTLEEMTLLRGSLAVSSKDGIKPSEAQELLPWRYTDPSVLQTEVEVSTLPHRNGDPRRVNGLSQLERLETVLVRQTFDQYRIGSGTSEGTDSHQYSVGSCTPSKSLEKTSDLTQGQGSLGDSALPADVTEGVAPTQDLPTSSWLDEEEVDDASWQSFETFVVGSPLPGPELKGVSARTPAPSSLEPGVPSSTNPVKASGEVPEVLPGLLPEEPDRRIPEKEDKGYPSNPDDL